MGWLLFAWLHAPAHAETLDRVFAQRVAHARAGQVARLRADYENVRELRLACRIEMREDRFPLACFATLRGEDAWALRSPTERARISTRLDGKCERATTRLILPPESADLSSLSPACRSRVREGRRIRAYREEEREDGLVLEQ